MKKLLTGIQEMITAGKTKRELAEHFGLENKYVVKISAGTAKKSQRELYRDQRESHEKMLCREIWWQSRHMKSIV